ncbi:hypothetical protein MKX01_019689 [Papaver californicum]|nr:hypothetical protein MKX01_019689 [Papaver californicum]
METHTTSAIFQILYGGCHIISSVALNAGINQIVLCVYRDLIDISLLAPVAYFRDKRIRLPINSSLLIYFFFLGLTGVFGNQLLFLIGLGYTNPTYDVVVQHVIHVFTFVFAAFMGYINGFVQGPAIFGNDVTELLHRAAGNDLIAGAQPEPFHIGMLCLIGNCFCMVAYLSLQALLLLKYPASLSVTAYSYSFGAMLMVIAGISATDRNIGIVASVVSYGATTWSKKILGAALVALLYALQPFASVFFFKDFPGRCYLSWKLMNFLVTAMSSNNPCAHLQWVSMKARWEILKFQMQHLKNLFSWMNLML